jgi:hypothetical protein
MFAVQMGDSAAGFTAEKEAGVAFFGMGAILEQGTVLRVDSVNPSGSLQLFQLAIDGGKANGMACLTQVGSQIGGSQRLFGTLLQTMQDGLLLFCGVYHRDTS